MLYMLERDDPIQVEVAFRIIPAFRSPVDCYGLPIMPNSPSEVELDSVVDEEGRDVQLTDKERIAIERACQRLDAEYQHEH